MVRMRVLMERCYPVSRWRQGTRVVLCLALFLTIECPLLFAQEQPDRAWSVHFEGNEAYSGSGLRNVIATTPPSFLKKLFGRKGNTQLREVELRRDVIRIERYYQRRGFDEVSVGWRVEPMGRDWKKRVIFEIEEGVPQRVGDLEIVLQGSAESETRIRDSRAFLRAERRHAYLPGNRYAPIRRTEVEGAFREAMQDEGYAYAEVEIEVVSRENSRQVDIRIINRPGPRMKFEEFQVEGEYTVDERIIIRETGIRDGDLYSRQKMQTAQRELINHHLIRFATVGIPDEPPADSSLAMTIRVREYPHRSVQATVGVGREELLRGQVSWEHRNVNSWAHRFDIMARASFIEQRAGVDYLIPYLFNTRSSFVSSPYVQHRIEPSFELFRLGFINSMIYRYNERLTGSLSYDITYNEELTRESETSLPDTVLNYNTASLLFSGYYSTSRTRSGEGWQIQPTIELSSLFSEGTFEYRKVSLDVRRYVQVNSSLTLAARVEGGVIHSPAQDSLPSTIRFFTGGTNSVRGWNRQMLGPAVAVTSLEGEFDRYIPIGGRALFTFNMELRQDLSGLIDGFGIAAFLDGGQVWQSMRRIEERPVQFGTGGGVRYNSPVGPVRVDIGYKVNPLDEDLRIYEGENFGSAWNRIGIHFSIGQAF